MSSLGAAIGTVFSSVATTVSNVGSAVMGIGSSLFTAGAAGAAGNALSGTLGNIVKGALTQGAIGALVGGGISALTGGSFAKGALMGGLGGALSGGFMGASGMQTNPFADGFGTKLQGNVQAANTATQMAPTGKALPAPTTAPASISAANFDARWNGGASSNAAQFGSYGGTPISGQGWAGTPAAAAGVTGAAAPLAGGAASQQGGLLSGILGNGQLIAGIGQGLLTGMQAREQAKQQQALIAAQMQREQMGIDEREREQARKTASYRIGPEGYNQPAQDSGAGRPEPSTKYARPRYAFDPVQGRVVAVG